MRVGVCVRRAMAFAAIGLVATFASWQGDATAFDHAAERQAGIGLGQATASAPAQVLVRPTALTSRIYGVDRSAPGRLLAAIAVVLATLWIRPARAGAAGRTRSLRLSIERRRYSIALRAPPILAAS